MIYMIRNKNTGLFYRHSKQYGGPQWSSRPRTFTSPGYIKLSAQTQLAKHNFMLRGNIPEHLYRDWQGVWHNSWSHDQHTAMWKMWKEIKHLPLQDLMPPEWEIVEVDPTKL